MSENLQPHGEIESANSPAHPYIADLPIRVKPSGGAADHPALLVEVPKLFSKELPPCGLIPQIAFDNVVERLRKLWFQHATTTKTARSTSFILQICIHVKDELEKEAKSGPPGSWHGKKNRMPWRREEVFRYELRWAKYFVEEAESLGSNKPLNIMDEQYREFIQNFRPIPSALQIHVLNRKLKKSVHVLWGIWNEKRRSDRLEHDQETPVTSTTPTSDDLESAVLDSAALEGTVPLLEVSIGDSNNDVVMTADEQTTLSHSQSRGGSPPGDTSSDSMV